MGTDKTIEAAKALVAALDNRDGHAFMHRDAGLQDRWRTLRDLLAYPPPSDVKRYTAHDLLKQGGEWLAAARAYIQRKFHNGSQVTWGTGDELHPPATVRHLEEIAAEAAAAAFREKAEAVAKLEHVEKVVDHLRRSNIKLSVEVSCRVEAAENKLEALQKAVTEHTQNCERYGPLADPSKGSYKRLVHVLNGGE